MSWREHLHQTKAANFSKQKMTIPQVTAKEEGYIFVYLSYESQSNNYVYFDDFKVTHTPTKIIQSSEYYPFGMQTASSWTRTNSSNNFLYNGGTESNPVTGMYDLAYRNYDPALGRFHQVDPVADKYGSLSAYNFAFNNPVVYNDPSGADPYQTVYEWLQLQWASNVPLPFMQAMVAGEQGGSGGGAAGTGTGGAGTGGGTAPEFETYVVLEYFVTTANGEEVDKYLTGFHYEYEVFFDPSFDRWQGLGAKQGDHGVEQTQGGDPQTQHEWQTWNQLTPAERDLSTSNPGAAWSIYNNRQHAFEITQTLFPNIGQRNTAADAFRHAYFNALNARDVGVGLAIDFGYAHESDPGNDQIERIMDLNNNLKGIGVGLGKNLSNSDLMLQIYNMVKSGGLLMIENGNLVKTHYP